MQDLQWTPLWRKNSLGIGTWRVCAMVETATRGKIFIAHSTVEGGSEVRHEDPVVTNNSGRTIQQQLDLEMASRISRMKDKGYKETREAALLGSTNQMGLANPMLALALAKVTLTQSMMANAYVQPKFDGHRCLITKQGGDILAYTRKGKPITTIPHILEDAYRWMQEGDTLDGELYIHGMKLQSISSLIKAEQPDSRKLNYHWYDMVDRTRFFDQRFATMRDLHANCETKQIELVPTEKVTKMAEVYDHFKKSRAAGLEGSMLRLSIAGYQDGARVSQLIKVKAREDGEVTVLGGRASSQGWAILRVDFNGKQFDISAPGSVPEKTEVLKNLDRYIGKLLTIEYAMLTDDGIPFHAVATRWRDDL